MRLGELCDLGGKLAQYRGERTLPDRPVRLERYAVAPSVTADEWPNLIGQRPWSGADASWSGAVGNAGGGSIYIRCDDWEEREVEVPVPAPRNGKEYGWTWDGFYGWQKEQFPRCGHCGRWHDPAFGHCERCDRATKALRDGVCGACRKAAQ